MTFRLRAWQSFSLRSRSAAVLLAFLAIAVIGETAFAQSQSYSLIPRPAVVDGRQHDAHSY